MLATELVRSLASIAFIFFVLSVIMAIRERLRSGKLRRSLGIDVHPAAKISWTFTILTMATCFLIPPFYPRVVYWGLPGGGPWIADWLQALGFALIASGGSLLFWAQRALGKYMVPEIMVAKGHSLVTEGPYHWIRHPAYTAVILLFVGLALFYMNPFLGAVALTTAATALYRARKEEELLVFPKAFGRKYREYRKRTRMFLPRA